MNIENILSWPSLAHELALEVELFGSSSNRVKNWLDQQLTFLNDQDFARLFSDNIDCFAVQPVAYNHRLIQTTAGALLGGIRFYGLDITRPFVEVVAHSFSDFDRLRKVVANEWRVFAPQFVRLTAPAQTLPTPDAILDVSIHGAPYGKMMPPNGELNLSSPADTAQIEPLVQARYQRIKHDQLELGRNIGAASIEDLSDCHKDGGLYVAYVHEQQSPIGVIAVRDSGIAWVQGDEVLEEVVVAQYSGNGYGAQMQMALAHARGQTMPDRLLVGTIDHLNHASRKSAERAGRPEIMRRVFLPL